MPEFLTRLLEQLRTIWGNLNRNQRLILFGSAGAVILAIFLLAIWAGRVEYVPLARDMTAAEANKIRVKLEELGERYQIRGGTLLVPSKRKDVITMMLAGEGLLPSRGLVDFRIFDRTSLGITDFERKINFKRATEGTLSRIIESLDKVERAEVMLAVPEPSLFIETQQDTTASVTLSLKPFTTLDTSEVIGIRNIVASAVVGLKPENVTIVDTAGRTLSDIEMVETKEDLASRQLAIRKEQEMRLTNQIRATLSKVLGPRNFEVIGVSVEMNFDKESVKEDIVNPVIISREFGDPDVREGVKVSQEEVSEKFKGEGSLPPRGTPGTESNAPGYKGLTKGVSEYERTETKTNFDTNKRRLERESDALNIERITAAVVVDGTYRLVRDERGRKVVDESGRFWRREFVPRSAEELRSIEEAVQRAIGFNEGRGDSVIVRGVPINHEEEWAAEYRGEVSRDNLQRLILASVMAMLVMLLGIIIYRQLLRRWRERAAEVARQRELDLATQEAADMERMRAQMSEDEKRRLELRESAIEAARANPEMVAELLRTWIGEE
jgi:flagellar M-ring protein FliF